MFLGSRSYYEDAKELGNTLLESYKTMTLSMFELAGYDEKEAETHWDNAAAFDASLAPYTLTDVQRDDPTVTYNRMAFSELASKVKNIDLTTIASGLVGTVPEQVIVENPGYFDTLDSLLSEESFEQFKSWMLVNEVSGYTNILDEEALEVGEAFKMAKRGQAEMKPLDEIAYRFSVEQFPEVAGQYYGMTYLGEEGRDQVTQMATDAIDIYRERLEVNDWLGEETREKAIAKLDAMTIYVGWPDKLSPVYSQYAITPLAAGGTLFDNTMALWRTALEYKMSLLGTTVDKDLWNGIGSYVVNAFYLPFNNGFYLPAAILTEPFYSTEQTAGENYGGIGVVIGHEITHAFDALGSQYDETGSLNNWWTEEDRAEFEARTQAMVDLFDGVSYLNTTINGELTRTENVADAGGLSCALQLNAERGDGNGEEFFTNYAIAWRNKETTQFASNAYLTDPHAPPELRVNLQLGNNDAFYEVYEISPEDGMYIEPERRVSIW